MVLTEWVRHALPLKLKDGKRHLFPTLASMVYKPDEANPDEFIPIVDENGKLVVDDAAKLAGKDASHYENIITSITANGAVVEPDEHGNVNLGNMQTGSSVELDDTLKVEGKAADAKATGDAIDQLSEQTANYRTAVNLLDNSYWKRKKRIVNQRGLDTYTGAGYTIDRWRGETGRNKITVSDNGLILSNTNPSGGESYFEHFLDIPEDKIYTFAAEVDGIVYVVSGVPSATAHATTPFGRITITYSASRLAVAVRFYIAKAGEYLVTWAALYDGQYTAATLPPYIPKGYAVELAACQQYAVSVPAGSVQTGFANSKNAIRFNIPEMSLMRKSGETSITLSSTSGTVVTGTGSAFGLEDKFSSIYWAGGHVAIALNSDVFTSGFNVVSTYFSGSIFISREIL